MRYSPDRDSWLELRLPNLPLAAWQKRGWQPSNCGKFISILDIHYSNGNWQKAWTSRGTFYLYGAYLDNRENTPGPTIRLLGMFAGNRPTKGTLFKNTYMNMTSHCQLWFPGERDPVVAQVVEYRQIFWFHNSPKPLLLSCKIPESHRDKIPSSVSLVEGKCDIATTNLRITYNQLPVGEAKEGFAVCVKGMDYVDDLSDRLTEWIELVSALGADKIFLYDLGVHPSVSQLLSYYSGTGLVEVTPLSLPGHLPSVPGLTNLYLKARKQDKRQNELIPYNDCFYRNMYR